LNEAVYMKLRRRRLLRRTHCTCHGSLSLSVLYMPASTTVSQSMHQREVPGRINNSYTRRDIATN